jgi:hypothetical protein
MSTFTLEQAKAELTARLIDSGQVIDCEDEVMAEIESAQSLRALFRIVHECQLCGLTSTDAFAVRPDDVAALTDQNRHTEARLLVAREVLENEKLTEGYELLRKNHECVGYLTEAMGKQREALDVHLREALEREGKLRYWQAL